MFHENLNFIAAALAMVTYATIATLQLRGKMTGLSLATYALWGCMDAVSAVSIYFKGGAWLLPTAYAMGCVMICATLLRTRSFNWTRLDTFVAGVVIASLIAWYFSGDPRVATVVATLGLVIACIPQGVEAYHRPEGQRVWIFVAYTVANLLSFFAGKDWSIQERFFPGCAAAATVVLLGLALRKFAKRHAVA